MHSRQGWPEDWERDEIDVAIMMRFIVLGSRFDTYIMYQLCLTTYCNDVGDSRESVAVPDGAGGNRQSAAYPGCKRRE